MSKTLKETLSRQIRQALRAFLRAAIPRIPVDTGESRGSLLHLSRLLRVKNTIKPRRFRTVTVDGKQYTIDNTELLKTKNKDTGAAQTFVNGRRSSNLTKNNMFNVNKTTFNFKFKTDILQIDIHDDKWGAFKAGRSAFIEYLEEVAPTKMPSIINFIETEEL
jgi:hypothetical protein